ncbi:hypothetical protein BX265_6978 [Streptomyces sp. TLI_235]|nr:hypothetical protein BX265_6978 [Streptomyces sp. TLI_235]
MSPQAIEQGDSLREGVHDAELTGLLGTTCRWCRPIQRYARGQPGGHLGGQNQIAFDVFGGDVAVSLGAEVRLDAFEPDIAHSWLKTCLTCGQLPGPCQRCAGSIPREPRALAAQAALLTGAGVFDPTGTGSPRPRHVPGGRSLVSGNDGHWEAVGAQGGHG